MKTYSRKKTDEQEEVILDLNELCRLCMTKEDELVPIFAPEEGIPLTIRIMVCASLPVVDGDGLPNKICHPCKYQLEKSYLFRKKCENSDMKLRQHVESLQKKLGKFDSSPKKAVTDAESIIAEFKDQETVNLVGAQVAYIAPEPELDVQDANITLPTDEEIVNIDKTKIKKEELNDNNYFVIDDSQGADGMDTIIEDDTELSYIAEAVKSTLASDPNFNLSGDFQMKVEQQPGKATQVSVTTEDGTVIVLELSRDDIEEAAHHHHDDNDNDDYDGVEMDSIMNEDGELKVFQCPQCPRAFARRIQLRRHSSVHMQQRGFSCGICEKWFPTRSALVRHERIHTGERPFQCEVCQKSFAQKEILYRHMMTHTGIKPYNCPHCQKGFIQKEPLRAHMKVHEGQGDTRMHGCTLCSKVFCHASGLSRHLVTHTGKTFKCHDCDKSFNDKSSLRRHIRQCGHQE